MENSQNITFIDLRLDYAFKLVFGTPGNEDLLLKLIDAILPERHFTSVSLSTNERVGQRPDSHRAIYDIFATTSDGSDVTIEMQFGEQDDFNRRMVFYSSFPVQNHILKGSQSFNFPNVYVIGITDFILSGVPENDDMINQYAVINKKYQEIPLCNELTYVTVELPKLKKSLRELETPAEYMLYAIRNIGEMTEMPEEYKGKGLDKLFELCKFANMTLAEQRQYLAEFMAEIDEKSRLRTAINKGLAEGRAEGRAEVAKSMLANGLDKEMISKCTGLSAEEIARL